MAVGAGVVRDDLNKEIKEVKTFKVRDRKREEETDFRMRGKE